jgi:hypothetical protein
LGVLLVEEVVLVLGAAGAAAGVLGAEGLGVLVLTAPVDASDFAAVRWSFLPSLP